MLRFAPNVTLVIIPILGRSRPKRRSHNPGQRVRRPRAVLASLSVTLAIAASACSAGSPSEHDRVKVVAGFYPLAEAAMKIGGTLVDVQNLTPPGVEPHDLELTPGEIADIQSADVVLYLGRG